MGSRELLEGGCHCGGVRFRVAIEEFRASECNCSMCTMKGILHLIVTPDRFELLSGGELLSTYTFNTGVAKHRFCRVCGIHPFYTPRSDPDKVDVNIRCFDGDAWRRFKLSSFDGKHWESAYAEREAR
ncbi:MAG TPA: GFA family protein [Myxococcota bacterium]|nr:GFA family protein [Myxococcota bacterium]